jgi:putative lipoprotein
MDGSGRSSFAAAATVAIAAVLTSAVPARADSWTGTDKLLHFGATAALSGAGYGIGVGCCEKRPWALLLGGGIGLGAGAAKELADLAGLGEPSWKDFVWDVAGTAVGLGIALCIDLAVRGLDGGTWRVSKTALGMPAALLAPARPSPFATRARPPL